MSSHFQSIQGYNFIIEMDSSNLAIQFHYLYGFRQFSNAISFHLLTFYSMIMPFDTFKILCISKFYGKSSICFNGANAPFSIIFSKVFKTFFKIFLDFFFNVKK